MLKHLFTILIFSSFLLVSCTPSTDSNNESPENSTVLSQTVTSKPQTSTQLILNNQNITSTKYLSLGNLIFFPDKDNNNYLSVIDDSITNDTVSASSIIDIFNYSIESLTSINDEIYFSNIADNNSLYVLNYLQKSVIKVSSEYFYNIASSNKYIFFINRNQNSSLSLFDIESKQIRAITTDKCGDYIVNGEFILYENLSDNSSLYSVKLDGSERTKLIDSPIDSFIPYNNNILYINSTDNNLYFYDILIGQSNRIGIINGTTLKAYNDKLFYISLDNSNHLYSFEIDNASTNITTTEISKDMVNEYYPTEKGIFLKKPININNSYYIPYE